MWPKRPPPTDDPPLDLTRLDLCIRRRALPIGTLAIMRVLIVEDEPELASAMRAGLRLEAIAADVGTAMAMDTLGAVVPLCDFGSRRTAMCTCAEGRNGLEGGLSSFVSPHRAESARSAETPVFDDAKRLLAAVNAELLVDSGEVTLCRVWRHMQGGGDLLD